MFKLINKLQILSLALLSGALAVTSSVLTSCGKPDDDDGLNNGFECIKSKPYLGQGKLIKNTNTEYTVVLNTLDHWEGEVGISFKYQYDDNITNNFIYENPTVDFFKMEKYNSNTVLCFTLPPYDQTIGNADVNVTSYARIDSQILANWVFHVRVI